MSDAWIHFYIGAFCGIVITIVIIGVTQIIIDHIRHKRPIR